jgi:hypothetical protein
MEHPLQQVNIRGMKLRKEVWTYVKLIYRKQLKP